MACRSADKPKMNEVAKIVSAFFFRIKSRDYVPTGDMCEAFAIESSMRVTASLTAIAQHLSRND
jgi:hypothetical protein